MRLLRSLSSLLPDPVRHWLRGPSMATRWARSSNKWLLGEWYDEPRAVALGGWAIVPPERRRSLRFSWNGRPFDGVEYPLPRPDVAAHYPFASHAAESGFVLRIDTRRHPRPWGALAIELHGAGAGYPTMHLRDAPDPVPMPDAARRRRVTGWEEEFSFRQGGYATFRVLDAALAGGFAAFPRILDWGCGCGRVTRHLMSVPGAAITGGDVDPDNVAWCRANLPGMQFEVFPLRPPTPLAADSFDIIMGVSVLTHLREAEQFAWLAELRRLLRPGGIALLTFHGESSGVQAGLTPGEWRAIAQRGLYDRANDRYDAELSEADYYRDTLHAAGYVRREWGRFFEVVKHCPARVFHQDLMVLRKR